MTPEKKKELKSILGRLFVMYHQRRECKHNGTTVLECNCGLALNNQLIKEAEKILEEDDVADRGTGRAGCSGQEDAKREAGKAAPR